MWCPTKNPATVSDGGIIPRLALIAALDTEGQVYFLLTHEITDSDVISSFLKRLVDKLDSEHADWKENSVILLDNAKYHSS